MFIFSLSGRTGRKKRIKVSENKTDQQDAGLDFSERDIFGDENR